MGQFDAFKKRIAGGQTAIELPVAVTNKGVTPQIALPMVGPQVSPEKEATRTKGGTPAEFVESGLIAKQVKSDRSKNKVRNAVTRNRGKDAVNVAHEEALQDVANQQKEGLLTTPMRERNGEVVDTDETMRLTGPATPAPDRSVLSSIEKSTGLDRRSGSIGNSARATGFAHGLDPEQEYKNREYDANREDLLDAEQAFNKAERESGSNLRSEGGITYEELETGTTAESLRQRSDVQDAYKTTETGIPKPRHADKGTPEGEYPSKKGESEGAVRGERATLDKINGGYNEAVESGAPSNSEDDSIRSGTGKDEVAKESSADASPGEEVDTSVNPETVGIDDKEKDEGEIEPEENEGNLSSKIPAQNSSPNRKSSTPVAPAMSWYTS